MLDISCSFRTLCYRHFELPHLLNLPLNRMGILMTYKILVFLYNILPRKIELSTTFRKLILRLQPWGVLLLQSVFHDLLFLNKLRYINFHCHYWLLLFIKLSNRIPAKLIDVPNCCHTICSINYSYFIWMSWANCIVCHSWHILEWEQSLGKFGLGLNRCPNSRCSKCGCSG